MLVSPVKQAFAGVALMLGLATSGAVSYRMADASCASDPPGTEHVPHDTRVLRLDVVAGWECLLFQGDEQVEALLIGWWPR